MSKFKHNDIVWIKQYPKGDINEKGRVVGDQNGNGKVFVTNMNMPFSGTISGLFDPDEIEHVQQKTKPTAIMRRERGTINDMPMNGRWVLRDADGVYLGHDRYRHDLEAYFRDSYEITIEGN